MPRLLLISSGVSNAQDEPIEQHYVRQIDFIVIVQVTLIVIHVGAFLVLHQIANAIVIDITSGICCEEWIQPVLNLYNIWNAVVVVIQIGSIRNPVSVSVRGSAIGNSARSNVAHFVVTNGYGG